MALKIKSMGRSLGTRSGCAPAVSLFWGRRSLWSGDPHGCKVAKGVGAARGRAAGLVGIYRGMGAVGARSHLTLATRIGARVVCAPSTQPLAWAMPPVSGPHHMFTATASHNMPVNADAQVHPAAARPLLGRRLLSR